MNKVTTGRVMLWAAGIFIVALGFVFFWLIRNVVFLLFVSLLVATGIEPVVNWLRKRGPFSRSTGVLAVYLLIFGVLALIFFLAIPPLITEARQLVSNLTDPNQIKDYISHIDNEVLRNIANSAYENSGNIIQSLQLDSKALSIGLGLFETLFSLATLFVIVFYWINEKPAIRRFILSFVPEDQRPRGYTIWESVEKKLGAWLRGQLVLMIFIGALAGIGYTVMGLKFAFVLAVFAGLTELVPIIGPYLGGAPAVLIALTQSVTLAIIVMVYIVILQLIEGNVLVPRVMESAVGVSPLTVIIGILIGTTLAGIGGALIAVPIAAAIQVIVNNILSYNAQPEPSPDVEAAAANTGKALNLATKRNEQENQPSG